VTTVSGVIGQDGDYERARSDCVRVLVSQALDDLDEARLDLTTVLQMVSSQAWDRGHQYASEASRSRGEAPSGEERAS
jgi:hypothetical protein